MPIEDVLLELRRRVAEIVPAGISITEVALEGSEVVVYTEDMHKFYENEAVVRTLAKELRKRITLRPDKKVLMEPERALPILYEVMPRECGIKDVYFDNDVGEVIIEAEKPGLAIGWRGSTVRDVTKRIGWKPYVVRAPPIQSSIIKNIRQHLRAEREFRRNFAKRLWKEIYKDKVIEDGWLRITALGGCREVGRTAFILSTPESRILIDCGVSLGGEGNETPYLYIPEASPIDQIDAVVITHAHLDHAGLVPLLFLYGYKGPIYATPPTRDLMALLQLDYIEVSSREAKKIPYKSSFVREALKHTITFDYEEVSDIAPDVKLTFYNAGHILGSSIAYFHIGDGLYNIAFTGDIKYERSFLFEPAFNNFSRLETLIMESTYGGVNDTQPSRRNAEENLGEELKKTISRGGKVIIPAFAVGRSQEVMIALEEMIREKIIEEIPVYMDGMIGEATSVHTAYPEYLNRNLKNAIFYKKKNPFLANIFAQVDREEKRDEVIEEKESSIILATSGMLNGGPVMEYLKGLSSDEKNMLIFVGYQAEGTLGRRIQKGWNELQFSSEGKMENIRINMEVKTIDGFSGHSDRNQLLEFVRRMRPQLSRIICMHGENSKCMDLASALYRRYNIETIVPRNLETLRLL